ncbi:MAG: HlyC/CorC family transporter [Clostridiales bacterium]|nr:HlyC/CorC family transporter [Clostridiales bacterium]
MDNESILSIIIIILCVILSGYFSATETAFSSLNRIRLKNMAEGGNKRAALAYKLSDNYDKLLSTILVGNNIVNIAAASVSTLLFVRFLGNAGPTVSTVVITVTVLIFGEISPKSIAKESPEKFAMFSAPFLSVLVFILTPINFLFTQWKKLLSLIFKTGDDRSITEEELLTLVDEAEKEGAINEEDKEMINNVIDFNDREVNEIYTPRVDIVGIDETASIDEITDTFMESGFSRIPIFKENIDNIIGVIHIHDFFDTTLKHKTSIEEIITPVIYVTPKTKINDLLKSLQEAKTHLAVVSDEYGGTAGIVTMEDILEELVGEIWDEHDEVIESFEKIDEGVYKISCSAEIDKMFEFFDLTGEVDSATVSGWIMEELGKIPEEGDSFEYENLSITVTKTDNQRIIECVITVKPKEPVAESHK